MSTSAHGWCSWIAGLKGPDPFKEIAKREPYFITPSVLPDTERGRAGVDTARFPNLRWLALKSADSLKKNNPKMAAFLAACGTHLLVDNCSLAHSLGGSAPDREDTLPLYVDKNKIVSVCDTIKGKMFERKPQTILHRLTDDIEYCSMGNIWDGIGLYYKRGLMDSSDQTKFIEALRRRFVAQTRAIKDRDFFIGFLECQQKIDRYTLNTLIELFRMNKMKGLSLEQFTKIFAFKDIIKFYSWLEKKRPDLRDYWDYVAKRTVNAVSISTSACLLYYWMIYVGSKTEIKGNLEDFVHDPIDPWRELGARGTIVIVESESSDGVKLAVKVIGHQIARGYRRFQGEINQKTPTIINGGDWVFEDRQVSTKQLKNYNLIIISNSGNKNKIGFKPLDTKIPKGSLAKIHFTVSPWNKKRMLVTIKGRTSKYTLFAIDWFLLITKAPVWGCESNFGFSTEKLLQYFPTKKLCENGRLAEEIVMTKKDNPKSHNLFSRLEKILSRDFKEEGKEWRRASKYIRSSIEGGEDELAFIIGIAPPRRPLNLLSQWYNTYLSLKVCKPIEYEKVPLRGKLVFKESDDIDYRLSDYDDSAWIEYTKKKWDKVDKKVFWFRFAFHLPKQIKYKTPLLMYIEHSLWRAEHSYLNGNWLGACKWNAPRTYLLNQSHLKWKDVNVLSIRGIGPIKPAKKDFQIWLASCKISKIAPIPYKCQRVEIDVPERITIGTGKTTKLVVKINCPHKGSLLRIIYPYLWKVRVLGGNNICQVLEYGRTLKLSNENYEIRLTITPRKTTKGKYPIEFYVVSGESIGIESTIVRQV